MSPLSNAFLFLKLTNRIHIMKPSRLEPLVVDLLFVNYTLHQSTSLNMSQYAMKGTDCKQRYDSCQMFGALQNSFRMLTNMSLNESSLSGSCGSVCSSQKSVRNKCGMSCKLVGGERERRNIISDRDCSLKKRVYNWIFQVFINHSYEKQAPEIDEYLSIRYQFSLALSIKL